MSRNHLEVYKEVQEGAITYFDEVKSDELITEYSKSPDINIKQTITVLIKQGNETRKKFVNSIREFEELRVQIEKETKKENSQDITGKENHGDKEQVEGKIINNEEAEISVNSSDTDTDADNDTEQKGKENKIDVDKEIEELKEKQKEMESLGELYLGGLDSINKMKGSLMSSSCDVGIMLEARKEFESANDKMIYRTAQCIVQKNILVARRECIIFEINKAIAKGEKLDNLQSDLIEVNNQVDTLDRTFENEFKLLRNEVNTAHLALQNVSKQVEKSAKADFRNSYKKIQNYNDSGILTSETVDINRNLNRFAMQTNYDDSILANGKLPSISAQTININGNIVRVVSTESVRGVDTSFMNGNTTQMETGVGNGNWFVTRDEDGDLIADTPELEDSLNKIGINSTEDIEEICTEMDEKAEAREAEEILEEEELEPPRYTDDDE